MTAKTLDGEAVAAQIKAELVHRVELLIDRGLTPGLGTVLVGDDGPSANYVAMKHRDCTELGFLSRHEHLPANATQDEVLRVAERHGLVVHMVSNSWMRLADHPLIRRVVVQEGPDAADDTVNTSSAWAASGDSSELVSAMIRAPPSWARVGRSRSR